jgi:uncharacterized protein (TIGR02996 family)
VIDSQSCFTAERAARMTTGDDLLQAIHEDPDDDVPRLVLADWLEEQGDTRGEFIRLQCDLEQLAEDDPQRGEREARCHLLQTMHERRWIGELMPFVRHYKFRRGFVDWVHISARNFLEHGDALFRLAPIRGVTLNDVNPYLADLAASPLLGKLTSLDIKPEFSWRQHDYPETLLDDGGVATLFRSPHLGRLKRLDLGWNNIGGAGLSAIAACEGMALTDLDLSHNQILGSDLSLLSFQTLRYLALNNNHLRGDETLAVLRAETAPGRPLEVLHLESVELTDPGLEALTRSNLTHLFVDGNRFSVDGLRVFAGSPPLPLRALSLNSVTREGDSSIKALLNGKTFPNLTRLSFRSNLLGPIGATVLANASNIPSVRVLDLCDNAIGDAGLSALCKAPWLSNLVTLLLSENSIHDDGAQALARSPVVDHISEIRLGNNRIGSAARHVLYSRFGHRVIFDS